MRYLTYAIQSAKRRPITNLTGAAIGLLVLTGLGAAYHAGPIVLLPYAVAIAVLPYAVRQCRSAWVMAQPMATALVIARTLRRAGNGNPDD